MNKILLIIFCCVSLNAGYANSTIQERENYTWTLDKVYSKKWIEYLTLNKLKKLDIAFQLNELDKLSFAENFEKTKLIPKFSDQYILAIRVNAQKQSQNSDLLFLLGILFTGNFVESKNYNSGINYLHLSAEKGNLEAQRELCQEYGNGIEMPASMYEVGKWCYISSYYGLLEDKQELQKSTNYYDSKVFKDGVNAGINWIKQR